MNAFEISFVDPHVPKNIISFTPLPPGEGLGVREAVRVFNTLWILLT
jgi:hypothetical protein